MNTKFYEKAMRTLFIFVVIVAIFCASSRNAMAQDPVPVNVGLETHENDISDRSFNWMAYEGLLQAEIDIGIAGTLYESATDVVAAAQVNGEPFEIFPRFIEPPDGSVDIYVPVEDNVVIKTVKGACTRGLANAWARQTTVMFSINDEPIFSSPEESLQYWGEVVPFQVSENDCANESDTIWVVYWVYSLGNLEEGRYIIHYEEELGHTFHNGMDYDGDGEPDPVDWHVVVDFNIIAAEVGSISGTVMEEGTTGISLEGEGVGACDYHSETGEPCFYGQVEADGSYTIPNVPVGTYRVFSGWEGNWSMEFYQEQFEWEFAEEVAVAANTDTPNIDFTLVRGGIISGQVIDDLEEPVAGIWVDACEESVTGEEWGFSSRCKGSHTDENGYYTIPGLYPANYRVVIWGDELYLPQFFNLAYTYDEAELVEVISDQTTENVNFELILGGYISGQVIDDLEEPVAGIHVDACEESVTDEEWGSSPLCSGSHTDENGFYTIPGLQPGYYRVVIWGDELYLTQFFNLADTYDEAELVEVVRGIVARDDVNFSLIRSGSISGTVYEADGSTAIPYVHVDACDWGDTFCNGAEADEFGNYIIFGLPGGDYRVSVWGGQGGWIDEFYYETPFHHEAWSVNVTVGSDTGGIDFTMEVGGTISGTVYEIDSITTIPYVHVDACSMDDSFCNGAEADEFGEYTIMGLLPDKTYRVFIWGEPGWAGEVYQETIWWHEAKPVLVGETGIDFTLEPGGSISGTVYDAQTNLPIPFTAVDIVDGGYGTCTDESGNYTLVGLPLGTYDIVAGRDFCEPHPYVEAIITSVLIDENAPDVGGYDFALTLGGSISGSVTAVGGGLIGDNIDLAACLIAVEGMCWGTSAQSDGTYTITGMPTGNYIVNAYQYPEGYWIGEIFDNTQNWDAYTPVPVTAGLETPDINFTLELGGAITGVVVDGAGAPIPWIWVEAYQESIDAWSWAQTDATGTYRILGLPGGDYRVYINSQDGWVGQDFPGNPVAVSPGYDTYDVDFTLVVGGTISGTVTAVGGGIIEENIDVAACLIAVEGICWGTSVQEDGNYVISGLPAGEYEINVYQYPEGYWLGAWNPGPFVLQGDSISGINFTLELGGAITGVVVDGAGAPIPWIWVEAYQESIDAWSWAQTDATGTYRILGLPGGDYRVYINSQDGWVGQDFPGNPVAVSPGFDTYDIDFMLATEP